MTAQTKHKPIDMIEESFSLHTLCMIIIHGNKEERIWARHQSPHTEKKLQHKMFSREPTERT